MAKDHPHYTGDDLVPALLEPYHNSLKMALNGHGTKTMTTASAESRVAIADYL